MLIVHRGRFGPQFQFLFEQRQISQPFLPVSVTFPVRQACDTRQGAVEGDLGIPVVGIDAAAVLQYLVEMVICRTRFAEEIIQFHLQQAVDR